MRHNLPNNDDGRPLDAGEARHVGLIILLASLFSAVTWAALFSLAGCW